MVGVAQTVEHWVVIPGVAGSSPVTHPIRRPRFPRGLRHVSALARSVPKQVRTVGPAPRVLTFCLGARPRRTIAPLAQLAEQLTLNQRVRGSSPWRRTYPALPRGCSHPPFRVSGELSGPWSFAGAGGRGERPMTQAGGSTSESVCGSSSLSAYGCFLVVGVRSRVSESRGRIDDGVGFLVLLVVGFGPPSAKCKCASTMELGFWLLLVVGFRFSRCGRSRAHRRRSWFPVPFRCRLAVPAVLTFLPFDACLLPENSSHQSHDHRTYL